MATCNICVGPYGGKCRKCGRQLTLFDHQLMVNAQIENADVAEDWPQQLHDQINISTLQKRVAELQTENDQLKAKILDLVMKEKNI